MRRTNIVIDEVLVRRVMKVLGVTTIRDAVNRALRQVADNARTYEAVRSLRGKLRWEGDIDALRRDRHDRR